MNKEASQKTVYGLIGRKINYSFSPSYFNKKFKELSILAEYKLFDILNIQEVEAILNNSKIKGLNVTIPYKKEIIPFLTELSEDATKIQAVNTIQFKNKKTLGYNTDWIGFKKSLEPLLKPHHQNALILGTGGASLAIAYALQQMNIEFKKVSRNPNETEFSYEDLGPDVFLKYKLIINTTPLGTHPFTENCPDMDYHLFTNEHLAYDLIYNPEKTQFLKNAETHGAEIKNGLEMLVLQAEAAWRIWNDQ